MFFSQFLQIKSFKSNLHGQNAMQQLQCLAISPFRKKSKGFGKSPGYTPEPIVLVKFNPKSRRQRMLLARKITRQLGLTDLLSFGQFNKSARWRDAGVGPLSSTQRIFPKSPRHVAFLLKQICVSKVIKRAWTQLYMTFGNFKISSLLTKT